MTGLSEFLLARISEDEDVAGQFAAEGPWQEWALYDTSGPRRDDEYAQLTVGAARVLAECEAKRRIVERFSYVDNDRPYLDPREGEVDAWFTLLDIALPYADHPDYRDEWKP